MEILSVIFLGSLIQLVRTDNNVPKVEYDKQVENIKNLIDSQKSLIEDLLHIYKIFNDTENFTSTEELVACCNVYRINRTSYIENVKELRNFIELYNLTGLRPALKTYNFLDVASLERNLSLTMFQCNVSRDKIYLQNKLRNITQNNIRVNDLIDRNSSRLINDIRDIVIPEKQNILQELAECAETVSTINENCKEFNETEVCETATLNSSYWELLRINVTDDLNVLNNFLRRTTVVRLFITYVQPILYIFVFISGFTGNVVLLIIFYRNKKFRVPQNLIIFNLALADTLSLIVYLPLTHAFESIGKGDSTKVLAQIFYFFRHLCLGLSIFSLIALCLQRFSATLKASNYIGFILRQSTSDSASKIITLIWGFAIVFAIPKVVHGEIYFNNYYADHREKYDLLIKVVTMVDLMILSVIPLLVISVLSWFTVYHFKERARKLPSDIPELHRSYQLEVLSRSTKVIMVSPLMFACTTLPFFLFYSLRNFFALDINDISDTVMKVISTALLLLSCSFNPIGLYVASGNFRRYTRKMFGFGPRKNSLKYKQRQPQQSKNTASENDTLDTNL